MMCEELENGEGYFVLSQLTLGVIHGNCDVVTSCRCKLLKGCRLCNSCYILAVN